jgi:soluble lytic murein transglycosylase-like protein
MSILPDSPIGNLKFYPVPPVPAGTNAAGNNAGTAPESFQSFLKKVSDTPYGPENPLGKGPSAARKRDLLELSARVRLQMNQSLLRMVSDTETETPSRNSIMGGLGDILSGGATESAFPSIFRQGPSETERPEPQAAEPAINAEPAIDTAAGKHDALPGAQKIDEIIREAAETYDVAPELIKGVIQAESNFNPNAISPKGAMGLMQLMPMTARELGVTDPLDPASNVMGGTRYLKKLLDRYEGSVPLALAAYNWGMGNLDSHRGRMPAETRNYVAKITRSYRESTDALA